MLYMREMANSMKKLRNPKYPPTGISTIACIEVLSSTVAARWTFRGLGGVLWAVVGRRTRYLGLRVVTVVTCWGEMSRVYTCT